VVLNRTLTVLLYLRTHDLAFRIKFNNTLIESEIEPAIHGYPASGGNRFEPILKKVSCVELLQHTALTDVFDKISAEINDLFSRLVPINRSHPASHNEAQHQSQLEPIASIQHELIAFKTCKTLFTQVSLTFDQLIDPA
jgi:hypothetical protein